MGKRSAALTFRSDIDPDPLEHVRLKLEFLSDTVGNSKEITPDGLDGLSLVLMDLANDIEDAIYPEGEEHEE